MLKTKLTAVGLPQSNIDDLKHMEEEIERRRLIAEKAREEYERQLHDYESYVGVYNSIVKSLNYSYK